MSNAEPAENAKAAPAAPEATKPEGSKGQAMSLPEKAKNWAASHRKLAIGGAVGVGLLAMLAAGAYPLWTKVLKPRLEKMKKEKATGRHVKRDVDDAYLDELLDNQEFVQFLTEMATELEK